jgi:hypothetical protein
MKWLMFLALMSAACGKSSDRKPGSAAPLAATPTSTTPEAAAATTGPQDHCEVHVTGSQTLDIVGTKVHGTPDGKISMGTEYWYSDDEIRMALATMIRVGGDKLSKAEVDRKVDEGMKQDPRLWLFLMNCATDDGFLNFSASNKSTSKDIPFGPHTYVISSEPAAGEVSAMFSIKKGKHQSYHLAAPGRLEVTKFDTSGITGTFAFEAETHDKSQRVSVKGSFDYGCKGGKCK